ncbi:MAG: hypothetical protein FGM15_04600 [Chthoniobacterales bacterium]|nr:hypothetical protein [Chthoniobacterales bacterium]
MKTSQILSVVVVGSMFAAGCQNMSPGENAAVFGGIAGAATGIALGAAGVDSAITIPVTAGAAVLAGAAAYVVSKQQATARQRQIALANARAAMAKMEAKEKRQSSGGASKPKVKKPQFIAVDTVAAAESPKGTSQVMVYDTRSEQIVGNNVYNVGKTPGVGSVNRYETVSAQYVGTGRSL